MSDYNEVNEIPYLVGLSEVSYNSDVNNIINNDISSSAIYDDVSGFNNAFHNYLKKEIVSMVLVIQILWMKNY